MAIRPRATTILLRHVMRAIRARWPRVDILIRGDSHYGRPEGIKSGDDRLAADR